jgi:nucleoside-diphosphate-sugar epimerase
VQGRLDPLDESPRTLPLSPYARSKALAETVLLQPHPPSQHPSLQVVVYRPTSVMDATHGPTTALTKLLSRLPYVPVSGEGNRPVPVGLRDNVACAALFCATSDQIGPIVLHPDEGITVQRLLNLFGARRLVSLPPRLSGAALRWAGLLCSRTPRITARLRWLELVMHGQAVAAREFSERGFMLPFGFDAWERLASDELQRIPSHSFRAARPSSTTHPSNHSRKQPI